MPLEKARRTDMQGAIYRQQYVRCGKATCRRCPPHGDGHGPYWYGYYWDYRQRTQSFYVGKKLPPGVEVIEDGTARPAEPITAE
jgi:hypothetical protein